VGKPPHLPRAERQGSELVEKFGAATLTLPATAPNWLERHKHNTFALCALRSSPEC
jgi:hypothetical protein